MSGGNMFQKYWVLVTRDNNSRVISLYSPDLSCELLQDLEYIENDFRLYAKNLLINHINNANISYLHAIEELLETTLEDLQHWECFLINKEEDIKFFSKILPCMGYIFNVLAISSNSFTTFMSLKIINNDNKTDSIYLAISAALLSSIFNFIMYSFSGASITLSQFGNNLDNLLIRKSTSSYDILNCRTFKITSLYTITLICTLMNVGINSISQYKQLTLLTEKYLDLYNELDKSHKELYFNLIKWIVIDISSVIAAGYCNLAFQYSFMMSLIKKFTDFTSDSSSLINENDIGNNTDIDTDRGSINNTYRTVFFNFNNNSSSTTYNQNNHVYDTEDLLYSCFKQKCQIS